MRIVGLFIAFLGLASLFGQGTLQFNRVLVVSNALQTVPAGKVWKVEAVWGTDRICIPCIINEHLTTTACNGRFIDYVGTSFRINGNRVFSERRWFPEFLSSEAVYNDAACTSLFSNYTSYGWGFYNIAANPNILPIWLPAASTMETDSPQIFVSIIEFNVLP
jgi:hypothetical protein